MAKIAFLGLGTMGYPMAGHLQKMGHEVCVYNRTGHKAEKWVEQHQGRMAKTPLEAAMHAEYVMICVGNDDDVRSVTLGDHGALIGMKSGAILIDHTSTSVTLAKELAIRCKVNAVHYMDAPVSGGQSGAEQGKLSIMVGGDHAIFHKIKTLLEAYAKSVTLIGPVGTGQMAKMVNQICVTGIMQSLAEGLNFARAAGLNMDLMLEAIGQGAAQSWAMEHRAQTMIKGEFDFGFAVDWMRKDLNNTLAQAKTMGMTLPVTAMVNDLYRQLQLRGDGRMDISSLVKLMA